MSKVWKTIQKVTYAISGFSMFAVIILIFINSLCRYIFKYSIPWCEEMTRFMFIATIFFTLNIMVANKAALRVDTRSGGNFNASSTITILNSSGSVRRCHSRRSFVKSKTQLFGRRSISAKAVCHSRTQPWHRRMNR